MALKTEEPEFFRAVHALRELPPAIMLMALYAAQFWSEERLAVAQAKGQLPGCEDEPVMITKH